MIDDSIGNLIIEYTIKNSNFEKKRNYISLSHCYLSANELIEQYKTGFLDNVAIRLKCYKGYQMERDLINRLKNVFEGRIKTDVEFSAFDGIVKGHPDFIFDGYPGDCKSVLLDEWIPTDKLPRKVYFQMQAYMKYSNIDKALVIYESRESGSIRVFRINANLSIQNEIHTKLSEVVFIIKRLKGTI